MRPQLLAAPLRRRHRSVGQIGEGKSGKAKLTAAQVKVICDRAAAGDNKPSLQGSSKLAVRLSEGGVVLGHGAPGDLGSGCKGE